MPYCIGENCGGRAPVAEMELVCELCREPWELERIREKVCAHGGLEADVAELERRERHEGTKMGNAQRQLDAICQVLKTASRQKLVNAILRARAILDEKPVPEEVSDTPSLPLDTP